MTFGILPFMAMTRFMLGILGATVIAGLAIVLSAFVSPTPLNVEAGP